MYEERQSIVFASSIENITPVNESFDRGILTVAYWGANRKKMYISREAFMNAIPSIFNCPVVCNYDRDSDSIGEHDIDVVRSNGRIRLVNLTTPVGVVPESAEPHIFWREIEEEDGAVHEYLCVPVLLWKRQEAYAHIKENGITDESMEIRVLDGRHEDDGYYHIYAFEFTAFCLLESADPCFESASVELFSMADIKDEYRNMMEDFKREFSRVVSVPTDDIGAPNGARNFSKGGSGKLEITELMQEYGLTEADVDFDMSEMTNEDIRARFAEIVAAKDAPCESVPAEGGTEPVEPATEEVEVEQPGDEEPSAAGSETFSLTGEQLVSGLYEALRQITYTHPEWGDMQRYCYVDYDPAACEVYVHDIMDWKLYGFVFAMNGDNVVIDFDSRKRKKLAFVDFDMGDEQFSYKGMFAAFESKFSAMTEELEQLREFKRTADQSERKTLEDEVFSRFPDLHGDENFEALRANCADMTIADIEDKCFSIRGRNIQVKFSQDTPKTQRVPVERNDSAREDANEPYHGLFRKYGY